MTTLLELALAITLLPIAGYFWFGLYLLYRVVVSELREARQ